jgi:hypothetical protein
MIAGALSWSTKLVRWTMNRCLNLLGNFRKRLIWAHSLCGAGASDLTLRRNGARIQPPHSRNQSCEDSPWVNALLKAAGRLLWGCGRRMSGRGSNRTTEDLSPGTDSRLDDVAVVTAACAGGNIVNSVVAAVAEFTYPPVPERLWLDVLSVNS